MDDKKSTTVEPLKNDSKAGFGNVCANVTKDVKMGTEANVHVGASKGNSSAIDVRVKVDA